MVSATDTAISVTESVAKAANLALTIGKYGLPIAQFVAGFIPGAAPVLQVLQIATPIIEKIVAAAPIAISAIESGRPLIDAMQVAAPTMLPHLKDLLALAINHDPARSEENLTGADISDAEALSFAGPVLFGRRWSPEETQRWWNKAQGDH